MVPMHHSYPLGDNRVVTLDPTAAWLTELVADVAPVGPAALSGLTPMESLVRRTTPSGAELALVRDVVVKLHHPRTDAGALATRLRAVVQGAGSALWVQPLDDSLHRSPDGRVATVWPRVDVLEESEAALPWVDAGRLLAALHLSDSGAAGDPSTGGPPPQGGPARVARALIRVDASDHPSAPMVARLGARLLDEATAPPRRETIVHGDWHLGQLARTDDGLRLLDVDDLGTGDPAWDLARPAGLWAAGMLEDAAWETFLAAYRDAGGPAVPGDGDPWPHLDLPARCAVFVAAVRTLTVQHTHSADPADALLEACARM